MTSLSLHRSGVLSANLLLISICWLSQTQPLSATDYFLTIGGGFIPSQNQASLEANVVFYQQVLRDKLHGPHRHDIYFADGKDPAADLQIVAEKPAKSPSPATDLLASLHRRRGEEQVTYRNHRVTDITGPLDPALIRADLEDLAKLAKGGDRLIIYVTAHGSEGPKDDEFNTTIDCWNGKKITAREFAQWLSKFPAEVPVVMVMAQCYCGGFARTFMNGLDKAKGLAPQIRAGFFAQQHNLPAAGCRPDIEHDEEFSNYFWGAIEGRSRNGVPIVDCDVDGNGVVSFAEAYAYAVIAGETIDIPLRMSDVLLRNYSRMTDAKPEDAAADSKTKTEGKTETKPDAKPKDASPKEAPAKEPPPDDSLKGKPALSTMSGNLQSFVDRGRPVSGRIVTKLSKTLGFTLQSDVKSVIKAYDEHREADPSQGRGGGRRRGGARRDLLTEVTAKWPELGDEKKWEKSPLLKPDNQEKLLAEIKLLPGWKRYDERQKQMEITNRQSEQHELREVKYRRLIKTLETIVLENNLPRFATPEVVAHFQKLMALEESSLNPGPHRPETAKSR